MGSTCLFWRSQRVDERRRICVVEIGYWPFLDSSVSIHYVCCWKNSRLVCSRSMALPRRGPRPPLLRWGPATRSTRRTADLPHVRPSLFFVRRRLGYQEFSHRVKWRDELRRALNAVCARAARSFVSLPSRKRFGRASRVHAALVCARARSVLSARVLPTSRRNWRAPSAVGAPNRSFVSPLLPADRIDSCYARAPNAVVACSWYPLLRLR